MDTVQGPDVSNWQGNPDWTAVRGAGHEFAIIKATESTTYVNPGFAGNRARAHAAGMVVVGCYHFARAGDPVAEANAFVAAIGSLAADEFAVLDWEVTPAGVDPVGWCVAFCTAVKARTGRLPLVYLNGPRIAGSDWSPLVAMGVRLWLAGDGVHALYDNDPKPVTVKWWGAPALKQYSESGTVPGIAGGVDLNVFYGDKTALTALAAGNDQEDDMFNDSDRWAVNNTMGAVGRLEVDAYETKGMLAAIAHAAAAGTGLTGQEVFDQAKAGAAAATADIITTVSATVRDVLGQDNAAQADAIVAALADRLKPTP